MKLLHVDSSVLGTNSVSRQLSARIVAEWQATHPGTVVEHLDLVADAPAHLDAESLGFRLPAGGTPTEAQQRENAVSERLVSQFLAADVVVIGVPFYNFTIPSQLKAWIDRLAQAGRTFRYTANGPEGLAGGKTVIVAATRGGKYTGSPVAQHQDGYLKLIFNFFGITDVRFVHAEGLAMGEEVKAGAIAQAQAQIQVVAAAEEALLAD